MFEPLRQLFRFAQDAPRPSMPPGHRAYVVGDIHGRYDLFDALVRAIEEDDAQTAAPEGTTVILLGDLVDRGPQSAQVIARAREWKKQRLVRILAGNHEEMFLESFDDRSILRHFLRHGGRETLLSYGIARREYNEATIEQLQSRMHDLVPREDRDFLESFEDYIVLGDYLFVHAGIRPEVAVEEQRRHDMLWIREPFLHYRDQHSHIVVHGHTISDEVDERANRIGIDTGAFRSGKLTALVLEGEERRYLQAVEDAGAITIHGKDSDA